MTSGLLLLTGRVLSPSLCDLGGRRRRCGAERRRMGFQPWLEPGCMKARGQDVRITCERLMQGLCRRQALDAELRKGALEPPDRAWPVLVVHDQLAEQAVVERRHRVALIEHAVEAHAFTGRHAERADCAGAWEKALRRILGVDADLDRMTAYANLILSDSKRLTAGKPDHLAHEVDAGDHLRHGMLDLDARVHLQEVEFVTAVVVEIFERSGTAIVDRLGERDRRRTQLVANGRRQRRRGSFLPNLLR